MLSLVRRYEGWRVGIGPNVRDLTAHDRSVALMLHPLTGRMTTRGAPKKKGSI